MVTIGIDEVGRGPIAGPVTVCAFYGDTVWLKKAIKKIDLPLRDSKKLSRAQREAWFAHITLWKKAGKCDFAVTSISATMIDTISIAPAIRKALATSLSELHVPYQTKIVLDGGLYAPPEYTKQKTIIKGDETEVCISLASIVAKVTRDRYMTRIAKKYPHYGFERHVGYGTREHYEVIKKYGLVLLHRKSFLKKWNLTSERAV